MDEQRAAVAGVLKLVPAPADLVINDAAPKVSRRSRSTRHASSPESARAPLRRRSPVGQPDAAAKMTSIEERWCRAAWARVARPRLTRAGVVNARGERRRDSDCRRRSRRGPRCKKPPGCRWRSAHRGWLARQATGDRQLPRGEAAGDRQPATGTSDPCARTSARTRSADPQGDAGCDSPDGAMQYDGRAG